MPSGESTGLDSSSVAPVRPCNAPVATSTICTVLSLSPAKGDPFFTNTSDLPSRVHVSCDGRPAGAKLIGRHHAPDVILFASPPEAPILHLVNCCRRAASPYRSLTHANTSSNCPLSLV